MESAPIAAAAAAPDGAQCDAPPHERVDEPNGDIDRRRLRKSDPLPPSACPSASPSQAASASTQRRASMGSSLGVMRTNSWEYPLSREEKKHRVMCLFQQELAEARAGAQKSAPSSENKASRPPPRSASAAPRAASQGGDTAAATFGGDNAALRSAAADVEPAAAPAASSLDPPATTRPASTATAQASRRRPALVALAAAIALALLAAAGLAVAGLAWKGPGPAMQARPAKPTHAPHPRTTAPAVVFPNATAHVASLREQGLRWLRMSDCFKATWFFRSALKQIEDEQEELAAETVGAIPDERLAKFFAAQHELLVGEQGFALVCSQLYDEGARVLERHMLGLGLQRTPSYLINALGFAHFRRAEYSAAGEAFSKAVEAEPSNPILWNNLAAARMVHGDIRAADDALFRTLDSASGKNCQFYVEEYHMSVFQYNVQNLASRANGEAAGLPSVELWLPA